MTYRKTGDLLDMLGEIGGFNRAIFQLGSILISVFTSYNLNNYLLTTLFRMRPRYTFEEKEDLRPRAGGLIRRDICGDT